MCDRTDSTPGGEIAALLRAAQRVRSRDRSALTPEQMGEELIQLRHVGDLIELEFSTVASAFAATDEYDQQGSVSPIAWMRHQCRMTGHAASRAICVGDQAPNLPRSTEAMADGRIGFAHLALLAGTAEAINESPTASGPFDEAPLLAKAVEHSVGRFRHDCDHARHANDAAGFLAEEVDAVERRSLRLSPWDGGSMLISGVLDASGGATLRAVLEPFARRCGVGDTRPRDRRLADALVELAAHGLDQGAATGRGTQRPHLQVTASLETLLGLAGAPAGDVELGSPISFAAVQRLACHSTVTRILLGPDSAVLDVGRARRVPSAATRKVLEHRDRGCTWPGCDRPASWTEAHHLQHWAHEGETEKDNLVLVCHRHHWMVHEGGWRMVKTDGQGLVVIPPVHAPPVRAPDHPAAA